MFCRKCGAKIIEGNKFCTECGTPVVAPPVARTAQRAPVATPATMPEIDLRPVRDFLSKNKLFFIIPIAIGIVGYTVYYFAFKPNPVKLAAEAAQMSCGCGDRNDSTIVVIMKEFNSSFDKSLYKKQSEARNALMDLTDGTGVGLSNCLKEAEDRTAESRGRFANDPAAMNAFDNELARVKEACVRKFLPEISAIQKEIDDKVKVIKDAAPDENRIKTDMIGQTLGGWTCQFASDIRSLRMHDVINSGNIYECQADIEVSTADSHETRQYNNARLRYRMDDAGNWNLNAIECNSFSITYVVGNTYQRINLPPGRPIYTIDTHGRRGWVKDDGWMSSNQIIGPDGGSLSLSGSTIFLASREKDQEIPITLQITINN